MATAALALFLSPVVLAAAQPDSSPAGAETADPEARAPASSSSLATSDLEGALADCRAELESHRAQQGTCPQTRPRRSSELLPGSPLAPDWPEDYGKLLRFPFDIADMKTLKEFAKALWQPDGTAASITVDVTDRGFVRRQGTRCVSEMVGIHPVGGAGVRWTSQLWREAQDWCLASEECTGVMLYVGRHSINCHHWCGRPQFCNGQITEDDGIEASADWNLFVRGREGSGTEGDPDTTRKEGL